MLRIPREVHHRAHEHGGVVVLNTRTGQWHALNPTAGALWRSWADGASFAQSVATVAATHPTAPAATISADASRLLTALVTRGLLESPLDGAPGRPKAEVARPAPSLGVATVALRPGKPVGWGARLVAGLCLGAALVVLRLPFRHVAALVGGLRRGWCRADVGHERAEHIVEAVRQAALAYPGRAACLETSLAAVLLAALTRGRLDWCLGAVTDPYRFHAWVESRGIPAPLPDLAYQRVFTI
ncbi:lasso peptide biosynthesis B2 protein [Nonomuraea sp. NBC_01738]|uniref:lasso peptide biosynthesis B2 protein n=1 Tax=Nonomuraea sp. NBC_01738 TaxID=2976003 RepID=UPI002E1281E6|nr:lasso peptide biosynthesis B2 protein [Nonomuraea sp. NBC_01738]